MKMIKFALLGTAAIAAVSVSARASELSDLKAQIEALNARVAVTEAQTAVPAGFAMVQVGKAAAIVIPGLAVDKNYGATATQISVVPAADMPASVDVQWSGYVRAALTYKTTTDYRDVDNTWVNVKARGEIKVVGKTETAVGEVGAQMKLRANWGSNGGTSDSSYTGLNRGSVNVTSPGAWGWWKMTPELTLAGGMDGSLAGNGFGYDGACTCMYTDNASAGYGHDGDPAQMRLSYASGPMSAAIAVEDYVNDGVDSTLGFAGEVKYSGDTVSGEVSAGYWDHTSIGGEAAWVVDAGLGFALSDMFNISASAGMGSGHYATDDFWKANILATANLSDAARVEVGASYLNSDGGLSYLSGATGYAGTETAFMAGIYYNPVSQLTIGLEAEYVVTDFDNGDTENATYADFVTKFSF